MMDDSLELAKAITKVYAAGYDQGKQGGGGTSTSDIAQEPRLVTGVVVTNKGSLDTVIIRVSMADDCSVVHAGDFNFDFFRRVVVPDCGEVEVMTTKQAREYDADFGIWFAS